MRKTILFLSFIDYEYQRDVVKTFMDTGTRCIVLSPKSFFVASATHFHVPILPHFGIGLGLLTAIFPLRKLVREISFFDAIIPLDDVASWFLRGIVIKEKLGKLKDLIVRSLGNPNTYIFYCSRSGLAPLARLIGVAMPKSISANVDDTEQNTYGFGLPCFIKENLSMGGTGVAKVSNRDELETYLKMGGFVRRMRRLCRLMVLRLAGIWFADAPRYEIQECLDGESVMFMGVAKDGKLLNGDSYIILDRPKDRPYDPATRVMRYSDERPYTSAQKLVECLGISGFVAFDFIICPRTGVPQVIECNARVIRVPFQEFGGTDGRRMVKAYLASL